MLPVFQVSVSASFSQVFGAALCHGSLKHLGFASLWPAGYVPASVLARREKQAERKRHEEEEERRRKEELAAGKTGKGSTNATAVDTTKKKNQKKKAGARGKGTM